MADQRDLMRSLALLGRNLDKLAALTEANSFLVKAMREHAVELKRMPPREVRALLRRKAQQAYRHAGSGAAADQALVLIEEALGKGASADIIPFPGQH